MKMEVLLEHFEFPHGKSELDEAKKRVRLDVDDYPDVFCVVGDFHHDYSA